MAHNSVPNSALGISIRLPTAYWYTNSFVWRNSHGTMSP